MLCDPRIKEKSADRTREFSFFSVSFFLEPKMKLITGDTFCLVRQNVCIFFLLVYVYIFLPSFFLFHFGVLAKLLDIFSGF